MVTQLPHCSMVSACLVFSALGFSALSAQDAILMGGSANAAASMDAVQSALPSDVFTYRIFGDPDEIWGELFRETGMECPPDEQPSVVLLAPPLSPADYAELSQWYSDRDQLPALTVAIGSAARWLGSNGVIAAGAAYEAFAQPVQTIESDRIGKVAWEPTGGLVLVNAGLALLPWDLVDTELDQGNVLGRTLRASVARQAEAAIGLESHTIVSLHDLNSTDASLEVLVGQCWIFDFTDGELNEQNHGELGSSIEIKKGRIHLLSPGDGYLPALHKMIVARDHGMQSTSYDEMDPETVEGLFASNPKLIWGMIPFHYAAEVAIVHAGGKSFAEAYREKPVQIQLSFYKEYNNQSQALIDADRNRGLNNARFKLTATPRIETGRNAK